MLFNIDLAETFEIAFECTFPSLSFIKLRLSDFTLASKHFALMYTYASTVLRIVKNLQMGYKSNHVKRFP